MYHAAEIVELLRVIELSGSSALACNAISKAQAVAAKSDKGKSEGNMIWKRNERIVKGYWCCAGDYRAIMVGVFKFGNISRRDSQGGMLIAVNEKKNLQKAANNIVSFNQNARPSENYPIGKVIFLDVIEYGLVFSPWLEPQSGDRKLLGFFQDAERDLFLTQFITEPWVQG